MENFDDTYQITAHVGQNIRERRTYLAMSQIELAETVGISFQQLEKYEIGKSRVSASRLYQISKALKTPVTYFFFGLPDQGKSDIENSRFSHVLSKEAREVLQIISSIKDEELKNKLIDFLKCFAKYQSDLETSNLDAPE